MIFNLIDSMIDGAIKAVDKVVDTGIKIVDRKFDGIIVTVDHAFDSVISMKNKMTSKDGERIIEIILNPLEGIEGAEYLSTNCENYDTKKHFSSNYCNDARLIFQR